MSVDKIFQKFPWHKLMPPRELDVDKEHLEEFFKLMFERQEIWYKRSILNQPGPWTDNPYLRDYKFTNVYRELDRNSQWLIKNVLLDTTNTREDLIFKILVFRIFNRIETFEQVKLPNYKEYDKDQFKADIDEFARTKGNPFTSSYFINVSHCEGEKRHTCYCNITIPFMHQRVKALKIIIDAMEAGNNPNGPQKIVDCLLRIPMVGDFVAHEFYQDFCYTRTYSHIAVFNKYDQNSWTNVGPGAMTGLRLIFPNKDTNAEQVKAITILRDISKEYLRRFGVFKFIRWNPRAQVHYVALADTGELTLHQIEMWLCEYSKYWKMKVGLGKQRSKYTGSPSQLALF